MFENSTILFRCKHCQHLLSAPSKSEGREGKCPYCDSINTVPENEEIKIKQMDKNIKYLVESSRLAGFIKTARSIVEKDATEMFSLEDIYRVSHELGLDGVIYLEQFDLRRHVTALLDLNRGSVNLYDPLSGIKVKPYDEIQFGMYCQPIGTFRDELQAYEQQQGLDKSGDVWTEYRKRARLLIGFLDQHKKFRLMYADSILTGSDLPVLQDKRNSSDCAPISLFIMSKYNSVYSKT